jgi:predicted aspartyl protease
MRHSLQHLLATLVLAAAVPAAEADWFDLTVPMQQQKSGNFYVQGVLSDEVATEFLVDTGSGYVSLSKTTFSRLKDRPGTEYVREIVGAMANGELVRVPIYRIATLSLSEQCVLADVEVAVFPGTRRDILGLSALRRVEPFALRLSPPVLMVSGCRGADAPAATAAASL